MRKQFCDTMVERCGQKDMVFMTGDLGFMALEPLALAMGDRFVNAGVSEQNMISVAAALAKDGFEAWAYSIAPFCYARPFEQIRNDVTFHNLRVRLVGNGGGYGYGVMGPTHHAIEDYGIMLALPNMQVFVPAFDEDVPEAATRAGDCSGAAYLRLGRGEPPKGYVVPAYAPWRQLTEGDGPVVIACGPLAGTYLEAIDALAASVRPQLWVVTELPISCNPMPAALLAQLKRAKSVCVVEEHVERGGVGPEIAMALIKAGILPAKFVHLYALAHLYERYGSQGFLRKQSRLDPASLLLALAIDEPTLVSTSP
ncbi:transketolase family protein [Variovorax terrae]|uniref:Transketolase n=1 Tax=Variovorax terrae TaxID=2923278 RepID=A0A9X2AKT1_9BURK|nr:transketolase C-terminal domain-containing protein [Variovorax terrae]MCJ0761868.1 transketolase [Variovorax terrae]